jgi:coenzyme F420-0:L-glutamate ligase/coenzyme F420-1:gamma-L-glutamate ligase
VRPALEIVAVGGLPEIVTGAELGTLIAGAAAEAELAPGRGDVIVISQKVVSKAEGRTRTLAEVTPGERARRLAAELDKDPRVVELVLAESRRVVRAEAGVLIVETSGGWVCANAGIDSSNVPGTEMVTLLPVDPDASARGIRAQLAAEPAARPGVVIADSFGRPWRLGQAEVAIGCAGVIALEDWRGRRDAEGHELAATEVAAADELAAAADLARSKVSREPAVLIRGAQRFWTEVDGPGAGVLRRPPARDLFR